MKMITNFIVLFFSMAAQAQGLRSQCENAYYATGYVKLHQYTVTVNWAEISDDAHVRLENIMFDNFELIGTRESAGKSFFIIKENSSIDIVGYELLLKELEKIPTIVSCTYDI